MVGLPWWKMSETCGVVLVTEFAKWPRLLGQCRFGLEFECDHYGRQWEFLDKEII